MRIVFHGNGGSERAGVGSIREVPLSLILQCNTVGRGQDRSFNFSLRRFFLKDDREEILLCIQVVISNQRFGHFHVSYGDGGE